MLFYGKRKPQFFFLLLVIVSEELASFPAMAKHQNLLLFAWYMHICDRERQNGHKRLSVRTAKPFVIRSSSIRTPEKIRSKRSTNRSNGLHIRSKYISICSKYCDIRSNGSDIRSNGFFIRSPTKSVRSENCGIRSNGLTPVLFIRSKGENCTRCFSTVIQCSRRNVAIHVHVTKSWDKRLTQLSF